MGIESQLSSKQVAVTDVSGKRSEATLLLCPLCKNETFLLYFVAGQTHVHLQCAHCGVSYCGGDGPCH